MRRNRRWGGAAAWALPLAGVALAVACASLFATSIAEIKKEPARYEGRVVTIAGTVTGVHDLLALRFYKVRDDTDEITVVTQSPLPKEGDKVRVTGKVNQAFAIGLHRLLVIEEEPPGR
jgi:aspartyl/asparaginyl-tRNA synthetase